VSELVAWYMKNVEAREYGVGDFLGVCVCVCVSVWYFSPIENIALCTRNAMDTYE